MAVAETIWDNVKQVFVAVVLALIIKTSIVEAYKIPTSSMEDTLLVGDFLLANKFIYGARVPLMNWRLPAIRRPTSCWLPPPSAWAGASMPPPRQPRQRAPVTPARVRCWPRGPATPVP